MTTYWEQVAQSRWGAYVTERKRDTLCRALERVSPAKALEVGCEGGRWSKLLSDRGWSVTCTDIDERALSVCQERLSDARCVLTSPESTALPCETGEMRLVLVYEVPEVIESEWILREVRRVLEPGGVFVCSSLNPQSLRGAFHRMLGKARNDGARASYRGRSYGAFRDDLAAHGFRTVDETGLCWLPFTRASDSPLVVPATALERALRLDRIPRLSPWILTVAISTHAPEAVDYRG